MSDSCVTTTMVTPCSRLSRISVSMISCEVRVSRLPVGSSASNSGWRSRALGARTGAGWSGCRVEQRQRHVFDGAGARQQIEALEHKAEPFAAKLCAVRLGQPRDIHTLKEISA